MLGVFGDYILSCTQGDILEIGVGESSIYLTEIAKKYNRRIYHCDISPSKIVNPLTVPGYLSEDYTYFEEKDPTPDKLNRCVCYAGPSDKFFKAVPITPIALAFIDGDHVFEQVYRDFKNTFPLVVGDGFIFLHDTYPPSEDYINENRCGNVYKLRQELRYYNGLDILTLTRGTAIGVGLTMVRKHPEKLPYYQM